MYVRVCTQQHKQQQRVIWKIYGSKPPCQVWWIKKLSNVEIVFIAHEVIDLQPRICSVIKSLPCKMRLKHSSKMEAPKSKGRNTSPSSIKECKSEVLKKALKTTYTQAHTTNLQMKMLEHRNVFLFSYLSWFKGDIKVSFFIVSMIEMLILLFNSDQSSSKIFMDVLARNVNQT